MIRICSMCKKNLGEKPPYEDKTITHGLCDECYNATMNEYERVLYHKLVQSIVSDNQNDVKSLALKILECRRIFSIK